MRKNEMIAMILAGGRGTRLNQLTEKVAKPAVYFGGKYRIIDFPLSNCANSGIQTVGVLTQYESVSLNSYAAQDSRWGLDTRDGGVYVLPPREKSEGFSIYRGTADAITQNIDFIDQINPEYVLILSGDHIYKMNYAKMLAVHKKNNADGTIAVLEVSTQEAKRFGIMNTDHDDRIIEFEEKPEHPKSNLASMGIYIFTWKRLRSYLLADSKDKRSSHDFGKDIIPNYLRDQRLLVAYHFNGYWKDVGTIESLWQSNMDLLDPSNNFDLNDPTWKIYTEDNTAPPHYCAKDAIIHNSMLDQGCIIDGRVENSVLFANVIVEKGAVVRDSVLLPGVVVSAGAHVSHAIVAEGVNIFENKHVGVKHEVRLIYKDI